MNELPPLSLAALGGLHEVLALEPLDDEVVAITYFDTADRRLLRRGITFRREGHGPLIEFVLDLPGPPADTGERRRRRERADTAAPPATMLEVVRGIVRLEALKEVVTISSRQRRQSLSDASEIGWAQIADESITVESGSREGAQFRRVGLEATRADDHRLRRIRAALARAGYTVDDDDRARLVAATGGALEQRHREPPTIERFVMATIERGVDRFLEHDIGLRLEPTLPPREVHRARVALRRLRAELDTLADLLDPVWLRHTDAQLKALASEFGAVRDLDVLERRLSATPVAPRAEAGREELVALARARRSEAAVTLRARLGSREYLLLLDRLTAAASRPPWLPHGQLRHVARETPTAKALAPLLASGRRAVERRAREARAQRSERALHRTRISAKKLRYRAELARPVFGKQAAALAKRAEGLQETLGAIHDVTVAKAWILDNAASVSRDGNLAAGMLVAAFDESARAPRARWRRDLERLRRARIPA